MINVLALAWLLAGNVGGSAWNAYSVHTTPVPFANRCDVDLRNTAYSFQPPSVPYSHAITLHRGTFTELNEFTHQPEWETSLIRQEQIKLGEQSARLVILASDHRGGGPNSPVRLYVLACENNRLVTVLEAVSEGLRYSYSPSGELRLSYPFWSSRDSHSFPSHDGVEVFGWNEAETQFSRKSRVVIRRAPP